MEQVFHQALDAKDPDAFFRGLSTTDRALLIEAGKVVQVKEDVITSEGSAEAGLSSLLSSCWTQEKRRVGENSFGYDLWRFYLRINWCEDGSTIQNPTSYYTHVDVNAPFWSYSGLVGQFVQGGAGYTTYDVFTQGEFKLCAPNIACAQYSYPWIDLIGYPGGWSSWTGGGGTGW
jgi:hypothetical protein